ncbi:MAG: lipid-A-disaccharide synthase N-terminal domain-containing protein [Planctomycetota bacterium]
MPFDVFTAIGWIGQGFFFLRFLIQWIASERAKSITVPKAFWWLSLFGSLCLLVYALHRESLIFTFGSLANLFLYVRHIMLDVGRTTLHATVKIGATMLFLNLMVYLATSDIYAENRGLWFYLGVVGQLIWLARFPIQWHLSERAGKAHLSPTFFWISLVGGTLLFTYALATKDPVWIAGTALVPIISTRNLILHKKCQAPVRHSAVPE